MDDLKISKKYLSILSDRLFNNYVLEEYPDFCIFVKMWLEQSESMYVDDSGKRRFGFWRILSQLDSFIDIDRIPNQALKMMIDTFANDFSDYISFIPYFLSEPEYVDLTLGEPIINFVGMKVINTKTGNFKFPYLDESGVQKIDLKTGEFLWKNLSVMENAVYEKRKFDWILVQSNYSFNPNNMIRQYDEFDNLILNYDNIRNFLRWNREFHRSKGNINSFYALFKMFKGYLELFRNADDIVHLSSPININMGEDKLGYLDIRFDSNLTNDEINSIIALHKLNQEAFDSTSPAGEPNYKFSLMGEKNPFYLGQFLKEEGLIEKYRAYWNKIGTSSFRYSVLSAKNPYTNRYDHFHGIDPNVLDVDNIKRDWWYTHFAYTIVTNLDPNIYKEIVTQILHPAGFHMNWIQREENYFRSKLGIVEDDSLKVIETFPQNNTVDF